MIVLRFTLFALRSSLIIIGISSPLHAQGQNSAAQPEALREIGIDQKLDEQIPLDLKFYNEAGQPVQLQNYFGDKPVILSLVYYECPMLCNQVLNGVVRSLRPLSFDVGKEFTVLTVSFDPEEKPELAARKKASYIKEYARAGAEQGWHFLTGDSAAIVALTRSVGFRYRYDASTKQFIHASGIFVITPQGRISRYFYGIEYSPRDLRLALVEASDNKIGSPVDQVLLYCFHYDPVTGKYGVAIMNVVRLAGITTVVILGTFMIVMFRRDRNSVKV